MSVLGGSRRRGDGRSWFSRERVMRVVHVGGGSLKPWMARSTNHQNRSYAARIAARAKIRKMITAELRTTSPAVGHDTFAISDSTAMRKSANRGMLTSRRRARARRRAAARAPGTAPRRGRHAGAPTANVAAGEPERQQLREPPHADARRDRQGGERRLPGDSALVALVDRRAQEFAPELPPAVDFLAWLPCRSERCALRRPESIRVGLSSPLSMQGRRGSNSQPLVLETSASAS